MQSPTERRQRLQCLKKNIDRPPQVQGSGLEMLLAVAQRAENREADELAAIIKNLDRKEKSARREKPLFHTVIIKPVGNRCNLRCRYCFNLADTAVDGEGRPALTVMSEEVLGKAISETLRTGPGNLHFVWHGGEPLLAGLPFFQSAVCLQKELNRGGKTIKNSIQTNGTLIDDKWIDFFKGNDFNISVSLDGPGVLHRRNRRFPSGKSSFRRVGQTIRRLQGAGVNFGVITVITPHMPVTDQELFRDFIHRGIYNFGVSPCCLPGDLSISAREYADFSMGLFDRWLSGGVSAVQINPFEDIVAGLLGYSPRLCWMRGTCAMFISIEPNGHVWPCCDRTLPGESPSWGSILETDLVNIVQSGGAREFQAADHKRQNLCLNMNCQWTFLCRGGCVYQRILHTGAADGGDPLCMAYREIFAHIAGRVDNVLSGSRYSNDVI